jgi:hypothetical protein
MQLHFAENFRKWGRNAAVVAFLWSALTACASGPTPKGTSLYDAYYGETSPLSITARINSVATCMKRQGFTFDPPQPKRYSTPSYVVSLEDLRSSGYLNGVTLNEDDLFGPSYQRLSTVQKEAFVKALGSEDDKTRCSYFPQKSRKLTSQYLRLQKQLRSRELVDPVLQVIDKAWATCMGRLGVKVSSPIELEQQVQKRYTAALPYLREVNIWQKDLAKLDAQCREKDFAKRRKRQLELERALLG